MIEAISAVSAIAGEANAVAKLPSNTLEGLSFEQLLRTGVDAADAKIASADRLVTAFTLDNDIPAHQVMFALEEARLSLEMMIQVRNRLVEGYQQIMNMQI